MAKNIDNHTESMLRIIEAHSTTGAYVSEKEREDIIQDIIASQRIEGIKVSYEMVAEVVDEILAEPLPTLK